MKKLALTVFFAAAMSMVLFVPKAEAARCPTNCVSWFDGCNKCGCKNGRTTFCTRKACKRLAPKRCLKRKCPTCRTMRCRRGYTCKNIRGCGKCVRRCPSCRTMRCRRGYTCKDVRGCGRCIRKRPKTCPRNCAVWFDGCNKCQCKNGKIGGCTKKFCKRYTKPRCLKRRCPTCRTMRCRRGYTCKNIRGCGRCIRKRPKTCPRNCKRWFDGCNVCQCRNGKIGACTRKACKVYKRPRCIQRACPTCRTMRCRRGYTCRNIRGCGKCVKKPRPRACSRGCKVWYDGCNTCQCRNGKIAACTKRACLRRGRAYCKKR